MKILLIDNGSSLLKKLEEIIPGAEVVSRWDNLSSVAKDNFDLIVLSGSKNFSVNWDHEKFKKELELIKNSKAPLIGICFGCELIAYAFGGTLKRLEKAHLGIKKVKILDRQFFNKPEVSVYEYHHWIIDIMPTTFDVLASSDEGPEVIKHKNLPIYGLQFHPENLPDITDGDDLFFTILKSIDIL